MGESDRITLLEADMISMVLKVQALEDTIEAMKEIIKMLLQHIDGLNDTLFDIAPDVEIIDAIADSEEERQEMLEQYMNHGNYEG